MQATLCTIPIACARFAAQVRVKRKYVRRKPPAARRRPGPPPGVVITLLPAAGQQPDAVAVAGAASAAANDVAVDGVVAHDGANGALGGVAAGSDAAASGEEALGVGRRHKPRKLLYGQ